MLKEQYQSALHSSLQLPIAVPKTHVSIQELNNNGALLVTDITRMLNGEGIYPIAIGSASILLQIGDAAFSRKYHDVDFLIPTEQMKGAIQTLERNGLTAWNEDTVHRSTRNLTGGFGRHHNWGVCSDDYQQETGLPVWIGIFDTFSDQDKTIFKERYAISKYKIVIAVNHLLKTIGAQINPQFIQDIYVILQKPLSLSFTYELIDKLDSIGIDFWNIIHSDMVNEQDIKRRSRLDPSYREAFLEVEMVQETPAPLQQAIDPMTINIHNTIVQLGSLENSYWRMKRYFPHYLGKREKYLQTARMIELSNKMNAIKRQLHEQMLHDRMTVHVPKKVFVFSHDLSMSAEGFDDETKETKSQELSVDTRIDYSALLLERVHYIYT